MNPSLDPGKDARTASGIPVVPAFDGYRAVAIMLIVVYHVALFNGAFVASGDSWRAVALFGATAQLPLTMLFIVSGFVLFLPTAARGGDFGRVDSFAIRRFARILPAYWLALIVAIVILAAVPAVGPLPSPEEIVLHVTMLQSPATLFDGSFALGFGVIAAVWTLSIETTYYIVLPLVAKPYYRRPLAGLAAAAVMLVAWRLFATHIASIGDAFGISVSAAAQGRFDTYYASQFPSWGLALAAGMTGAWAFVQLRERVPAELLARRAAIVAVAAAGATAIVAAFAGVEATNDPDVLTGLFARESVLIALVLPLVLATAMIALCLSPRRIQAPFAAGPLRAMGDVSYSVYLIHLAVLVLITQELGLAHGGALGNLVLWCSLTLVTSFAYAYLSSTLLERPIRRWARRLSLRRAAADGSGGSAGGAGAAASAGDGLPAPPSGGPTPAVSIVIPTFNREGWLAGAVDSVLDQDYENLELLVVDDGSSDGTAELLRGYERRLPRERFRFIRQANAGQARALNRGNAEARGEILGYLSDDDALLPGAVSRLAAELIADPSVAIAYPGYREIEADGQVMDTVRPIAYDSRTALRMHDTVIGPGALARREALESAGGWDPSLRWLGDLVLWIGAGLTGRAVRVTEPLALWRRHPDSATVQPSIDHAREHLRCVEIASGLDGIGPLSTADRAEALRNACVMAALFSGGFGGSGGRYCLYDLQRRQTHAVASRLGPDGDIDWAQSERTTELFRELFWLVVPPGSVSGGGGLARARARLSEVGALPGTEGSELAPINEVGRALIEAAFECGADIDYAHARFLIYDRETAAIDDGDLSLLNRLAFSASAEELTAAVESRRAKV